MHEQALTGVNVAGIASAVPARVVKQETFYPTFGEEEVRRIVESTGVRQRHASQTLCASDLCHAAAERLLAELDWAPESVGGLIFVTQTPDYLLPASSCVLHGRLKLSKRCLAFDVNLGCSGYTYGLWTAGNLMASMGIQRFLLLVGDTSTRIVSPQDRATALLFGDAGSATALELSGEGAMHCSWGTDGTGASHIIRPASLFRQPLTGTSALRVVGEDDDRTHREAHLCMNGAEVFSFTLREVPAMVEDVLRQAGWSRETVDAFVFHQANQFMLKHLAKKMRLPEGKLPGSLATYGNTSSASIPLTINHALADELRQGPRKLLLAGFGVGLSWAAVTLTCGPMALPEIVQVAEAPAQPRADLFAPLPPLDRVA